MALKLDKVSRGPHLPTLVSREIAQGRLAPGAQLPTEQALAQTFGVSRNVIREAVARLRSEGRVWSQQGRGAFVSDSPPPAAGAPRLFKDRREAERLGPAPAGRQRADDPR